MAELKDRLKVLMRNECGISPIGHAVTQSDIARALNVKRQTVSLWIIGTTEPTAGRIKDMAKFFGVSSDFLLGISDSTGSKDSHTDEKLLRIADIVERLQEIVKEP